MMSDYIDIDTPIDVAVYQRNRRIQVTLRQILDSNDAKYQTADVVPMDFHERCLQIEIQKRMALEKADAREVVYCKDCRHRDPEDHKCDCGGAERQGCPFKVADDYFCAYGER